MDDLPPLNRPEPLAADLEVIPYRKRLGPEVAVDYLMQGHHVLVRDFYSSGLAILERLKSHLKQSSSDDSFSSQRERRGAFRELSNRLLLEVRGGRLTVRKAPEIGWLSILYPDTDEFLLPFGQVQGLNSAWQWRKKGISLPVLPDRIHPFYGTYFPTRFEHLQLLDDWLKGYAGGKTSAIDVGVGCGVITYQLLNHGYERVRATDSNPNAIHGMRAAVEKKRLSSKVDLGWGDLFAGISQPADLIVFNPPWLPLAPENEGIDQAMYYDADLFPRFFAAAVKHLNPGGRLVLLFSNLAQVTGLTTTNPIVEELEAGGRFVKESLVTAPVTAASKKTHRNQTWRENEQVELWVMQLPPD